MKTNFPNFPNHGRCLDADINWNWITTAVYNILPLLLSYNPTFKCCCTINTSVKQMEHNYKRSYAIG